MQTPISSSDINPLFSAVKPFATAPSLIGDAPANISETTAAAEASDESSIQPSAEGTDQPKDKPPAPLNFELRQAFSSGALPFDPNLPTVMYPSASREGTHAAVRKAPSLSISTGAKLDRYAATIRDGLANIPMSDDQDALRGREDAMFQQAIDGNGKFLGGFVPPFTLKEGVKPAGESARNLVRSSMKLGTVFSVPLWHSGFWITLRTLPEGELLELHRQLTQDKVQLGRATYGMLYSGMTSYTAKTMVEFLARHMHSSSLEVAEDDSVFNYIKAPDYQLLLWGLTCATWPNGYQFQRACITDVEKCQHVVNERVSLAQLLWTDGASLSVRQKTHMTARRKGSMTVEQVKTYQDEFLRGRGATIKINDRLSVTLKMPLLNEYIDAGYKWISMLEEQYGKALEMPERERDQYLINQAQAQAIRQFGHFVSSITIDEHELDDSEDVPVILGDLSADDDIRKAFSEAVLKFQNDSIISFVGIPNYKCPSCGGNQNPTAQPGQKHELIALDIAQTFFTLLMQKLARIRDR